MMLELNIIASQSPLLSSFPETAIISDIESEAILKSFFAISSVAGEENKEC